MTSDEIRQGYLDFFASKEHVVIPSSPLLPQNDPTTLFNSSGMQPLVPYLLGQKHPAGKRLVNSQKSFRAQDIEEVGDNRHTTFFEMLGNWSLGDYFKSEQLRWIFSFFTEVVGLDPKRLYVSVFEGNDAVQKDIESIQLWKELFSLVGIEAKEGKRIWSYPARKNWWSRSGEPEHMPPGEPGGPDSEVFFDFGEELRLHEQSSWNKERCHPNCDCGRFVEIGNSVFMQYKKEEDGSLVELPQKNVDFGGGLERIVAASLFSPDVFVSDLFKPLIREMEVATHHLYSEQGETKKAMRIIADHVRGAVMMMADGVIPSNKQQGYVLRRLIRRSLMYLRQLGVSDWRMIGRFVVPIAEVYKHAYPDVLTQSEIIQQSLEEEAHRFGKTLEKGMTEIKKIEMLDGTKAFRLYETYGFPWEMTAEIATQKGQEIHRVEFEAEFKKHQELSRTSAAGMFKGGLADHSQQTTCLHTAHHLLLAALQKIVDPSIKQRGSNITAERLRIDVSFSRKFTQEELESVTQLVNSYIAQQLPVVRIDMPKQEAETLGAQMEFGKKYPDVVSVYFIGGQHDFVSAEFCGGPHVSNTKELGTFRIVKEESVSAGVRRLYASLS
jgi:alanyl-tRNA synthetase